MTRRTAGFSLVEALLACALLAAVIIPALGAFRAHLAAVDRMETRLLADHLLAEQLAESELRILAGTPGARPSGYARDGWRVREKEPAFEPCGTNRLWRMAIAVTDPRAQLTVDETRLLIHAPPPKERMP